MPQQDDSAPVVLQSGGEAADKTEAHSTPDSQPVSNALLPDKSAQVPEFVSCLASEAKLNEEAINAILPIKEKE